MNHQQIITEVGSRYKQLDDAVKRGRLDLPTAVHNYAWLARKDLGPGHLAMGNLNAAQANEANDSEASIPFVISTYSEDRDGDVVVSMGCRLHNYINNPVVFFGHQDNPLPIAKSMNPNGGLTVFPEENRIWAVAYFDKADEDAMNVYGKVKRGFLSATSIAFVPIVARRRDDIHKAHQHEGSPGGWIFDEIDTTEWSVVGVPSNPQATVLQKNLRGGLRDLVDSERRSTSPRLLKALEPYCAKSINESGGCWSGWCPTPQKAVKPVAKAAGCSCHAKTKQAPKKALGDIQVGDHVWVDQFDRGKVTAIYNGKATIQFSDGTREEYPMARLDKGIKKTQLDMEHGTTAGEIDLTKDLLSGGIGDEANLQLEEGIRVEMEHTDDPDVAREIAMDHLTEDLEYYSKLRLVEGKSKRGGVTKMVQDPAFKAAMELAMSKLREISNARSGPKFGSESASKQTAQLLSDAAKQARVQVDSVITSMAPKLQAAAKQEADARFGSFLRAHLSLRGGMAKYITVNGVRYKSMSESSGADGGYVVPPEQKSGPDVEYDQGYVAAWDGRARATNPYKNDNEGRGPEMRQDWDAGWVDGAKERLTGRKSAKRAVRKAMVTVADINVGDKIAWRGADKVVDHVVQGTMIGTVRIHFTDGTVSSAVSAGMQVERKGLQQRRKSCSFCRGTGNGCGRPGDCPTCAGKGWTKSVRKADQFEEAMRRGESDKIAGKPITANPWRHGVQDYNESLSRAYENGWNNISSNYGRKGKNMRRRKALDETEQDKGVDEPMVHPHESAIADLYKRAKDEHAYVTEQLSSITPFDPQTGDANKAHADLKEYGDQVGQRLESLKAMFGAHSEKDIDELTDEVQVDKSEVGSEEWADEEANEPQHMGLDDEEAMGMVTSGDGIANTGEANLVDRGEVPPDAAMGLDDELQMAEEDDVTKAAEDEQLEKDLNGDLDEDIEEATEDHATEEVLERYQEEGKSVALRKGYFNPGDRVEVVAGPGAGIEGKVIREMTNGTQVMIQDENGDQEVFKMTELKKKSLVWRTRKASTSRIAKVLRAGGSVKRGLDGRRWLVLRSVRKGITVYVNQAQLFDLATEARQSGVSESHVKEGELWKVTLDGPNANQLAMKYTTGNPANKRLRRKDLAEQDPNQVQLELDPAHAEAIKACGSMMKGLAVAHDMPEHHKSALDMHGDALAKSLEEGGHEEAATKALKHMKSLKEAPDVPEHHKAAMSHHSKAMAKALKAMGAEEEAPVEEAEGDEEQVAKDDGSDQVSKALMDSLRDSALMLERTSHRVGIKV